VAFRLPRTGRTRKPGPTVAAAGRRVPGAAAGGRRTLGSPCRRRLVQCWITESQLPALVRVPGGRPKERQAHPLRLVAHPLTRSLHRRIRDCRRRKVVAAAMAGPGRRRRTAATRPRKPAAGRSAGVELDRSRGRVAGRDKRPDRKR
jgi:hypothetical protein